MMNDVVVVVELLLFYLICYRESQTSVREESEESIRTSFRESVK